MKKYIYLTLLFFIFTFVATAQQLEDGKHKYSAEDIGFEMYIDVTDGGEIISEVVLVTQTGELRGTGYWFRAPRHSDFEGEGWYEVVLPGNYLNLEMDVISDNRLKIRQNIEGVDMVMVVEKSKL